MCKEDIRMGRRYQARSFKLQSGVPAINNRIQPNPLRVRLIITACDASILTIGDVNTDVDAGQAHRIPSQEQPFVMLIEEWGQFLTRELYVLSAGGVGQVIYITEVTESPENKIES